MAAPRLSRPPSRRGGGVLPMDALRPDSARIRFWKRLALPQGRRDAGLCLVEGRKVVEELLASSWKTRELLVLEGRENALSASAARRCAAHPPYGLTLRQWRQLSQDPSPEGIMAVAEIPAPLPPARILREAGGHLLLLHGVNNPNNLGALLRTAHWFGFQAVLLDRGAVDATNPKVVRASMGSLFFLSICERLDFTQLLPEVRRHLPVVAACARGGIQPQPRSGRTALLLGSESHGLPEALLRQADERWTISAPAGDADSLSLPQAGAILMYIIAQGGNRP